MTSRASARLDWANAQSGSIRRPSRESASARYPLCACRAASHAHSVASSQIAQSHFRRASEHAMGFMEIKASCQEFGYGHAEQAGGDGRFNTIRRVLDSDRLHRSDTETLRSELVQFGIRLGLVRMQLSSTCEGDETAHDH
jgi:hypothetical protein